MASTERTGKRGHTGITHARNRITGCFRIPEADTFTETYTLRYTVSSTTANIFFKKSHNNLLSLKHKVSALIALDSFSKMFLHRVK